MMPPEKSAEYQNEYNPIYCVNEWNNDDAEARNVV